MSSEAGEVWPSKALRTVAVVAVLAVSLGGCVGDGPVSPETKLPAFGLLGGLGEGEALTLRGDDAERIVLPGMQDGADFVIVPFFGAEGAGGAIEVEVEGANLLDVVGAPGGAVDPATGAVGLDRDLAFPENGRVHRGLREAERRELGPLLRGPAGRSGRSRLLNRLGAAGAPPAVGDTISLRTLDPAGANDFCADPLDRGGRVAAVTDEVIVVSDTASPAELTDARYQGFADEFGGLVEPVIVENFGAPTDIDENGRVIVFFTPVVNELGALGFHFAGDLFPTNDCAASNEGEILYVMSPDPDEETSLPIDPDVLALIGTRIIGHELQHLVNAGRRIFVNEADRLEASWLNEGLSHIAEELLFYALTPLGPGENISLETLQSSPEIVDAANRMLVGDLGFYFTYAAAPTDATFAGAANPATRGAAWAFLRYAADHQQGEDARFFFDLVNSTTSGVANLDAAVDFAGALDLMQAWTASVFSDDWLIGLPDFLKQPSWNFRSILPVFSDDGFPLDVQVIDGNGSARATLRGGGSAFIRVRVGEARQAEVRINATGSPGRALRVSVVRAE